MFKLRSKSRYRPVKLGDVIVLAVFICLPFIYTSKKGSKVIIRTSNEKEFIYSLEQARKIELSGPLGQSTIEIKNSMVRMKNSPCPLKLCRRTGWISEKGEQIICIPNKIYIKIEGEEIDGITH